MYEDKSGGYDVLHRFPYLFVFRIVQIKSKPRTPAVLELNSQCLFKISV